MLWIELYQLCQKILNWYNQLCPFVHKVPESQLVKNHDGSVLNGRQRDHKTFKRTILDLY